jgi:cell fate regulator YaaT (PSP1 superfamily)
MADIEFQGMDLSHFYYTANDRVDFRMLIKDFAKEFSTRVEMKQGFPSSSRLELSCGRELCSTWLTDLEVSIPLQHVTNNFLYPQKLAGQCGKLSVV